MSVSVKTYISNIIDVLIKVILPGLNSPFARIQLSYAIDLLNQLQNQVEYRRDVMFDDGAAAKEMLDIVCSTLTDHRINIPEDIAPLAGEKSFHLSPASQDITEAVRQVEGAAAKALDLMYEENDKIRNFSEVENKLLDLSLKWVLRKEKLRAPTINLELLESG